MKNAKEINSLRNKHQFPVPSSIRNLNPFLDNEGVLRACGRIRVSASLTYDKRHPIIPYSCSFSRLLVHFTHRISMHGGNQLIMRRIRSYFWFPKLKVLVSHKSIHSRAKNYGKGDVYPESIAATLGSSPTVLCSLERRVS